MTTHDASDRAHRAPVRDPRAAATTAAVPDRVRRAVGRFGGNVPHVGLRTAGGARAVGKQGPGPGGPRRPRPAVVPGGTGRGARRPRAHPARCCTHRSTRSRLRASGRVWAPRAPGDAHGRPRVCRAVLQAVLLPDRPEAHAPAAHPGACRLATTAAAGSGRPRTHANGTGPADRRCWESRRLSVGNPKAATFTDLLEPDCTSEKVARVTAPRPSPWTLRRWWERYEQHGGGASRSPTRCASTASIVSWRQSYRCSYSAGGRYPIDLPAFFEPHGLQRTLLLQRRRLGQRCDGYRTIVRKSRVRSMYRSAREVGQLLSLL